MRGDRKSDRQMTDGIATQLFYFLLCPSHVIEDCGRPPDEGLAQRCRCHAFGPSLEQRGTDFALQFGQAASEARLCSAELTGSRAQTAVLGDGDGTAEMAEFHAGSPWITNHGASDSKLLSQTLTRYLTMIAPAI